MSCSLEQLGAVEASDTALSGRALYRISRDGDIRLQSCGYGLGHILLLLSRRDDMLPYVARLSATSRDSNVGSWHTADVAPAVWRTACRIDLA